MASKILVNMSSREYYSGAHEFELPCGLLEEHIESVGPEGYGEFAIILKPEAYPIIEAVLRSKEEEWQKERWGPSFYAYIDDEWKAWKYPLGTIAIQLNHEMAIPMEFCEVDENIVDHWEVTDGST